MRNTLVGLLQIMLVIVGLLAAPSWAQEAPPDVSPEKAKQFLELISDPEIKSWLAAKVPAGTEASSGDSFADAFSAWGTTVKQRFDALIDAVPRLPQDTANAAEVIARDLNADRTGTVIIILAVLILVAFGVERLVRRAIDRRSPNASGEAGIVRAVSSELSGLLAFSVASLGLFLTLSWPPLLSRIVITLLLVTIAFRIARTVVALFLKYGRSDGTDLKALINLDDASAHFWSRWLGVMMAFLLYGWALVNLMPHLGFSQDSTRLVAYFLGLGILATAITIVWSRPSLALFIIAGGYLLLLQYRRDGCAVA